ncbi:MAG: hypothetical protein M3Y32_13295 [Pseudomonadota bacterium]|nr:hypothetical protein [Pseudomonadota bacterium]
MKLTPFSAQYLRPGEALPFGVRDATGRLLLAAGQVLRAGTQSEALRAQALFADEAESAEWTRRLGAALDTMIRQNATLKEISEARPDAAPTAAAVAAESSLPEKWDRLVTQLDAALRDLSSGSDWLERVRGVQERARTLAQKRPDASLYHLIYTAGDSSEKYSSHHALLTMLICEQAAPLLQWPQPHGDTVGLAALLMNVAMQRLQDQLALSEGEPSAAVRSQIRSHAETGARLLHDAGLADLLCLMVVRLHHDGSMAGVPLAAQPTERRLANLLRRVDIFCAKMSRRRNRMPMSPVQAAREACLGPDGRPDEIGGALLRAVGLYPPGSFVELVSGELGIVLARGRRANLPLVAALISPGGTPLGEPALRDTIEARHAVKGAVAPAQVRVRPQHERLLAMR